MKRFLFFLLAAFIIVLAHYSVSPGAAKTQFNIVYTNDVMGEVEPCG